VFHWKNVLERPLYDGVDAEFNLPDDGWDLISNLVNEPQLRYRTPQDVQKHAFMKSITFESLRDRDSAVKPPLVPKLRNDLDTGYFDDFSNPQCMLGYSEITNKALENEQLKQNGAMTGLNTAFVGFTFRHRQEQPHEAA
jgi:hypothetical protein